ncbi:MAG TPA: DUF3467 domain-containing protein [Candidatus Methylomirabilis sp.]|nr:DUF3467 domain-containing protein [Candidatus Methylomirabilis sp.]
MTRQGRPDPEKSTAGRNPADRPQMPWSDPGIEGAYANVFTISATRDEIVFLFGLKPALKAEGDEMTVGLSNRVVLAPPVAQRMLAGLNSLIHAYESEYGSLDLRPASPDYSGREVSLGRGEERSVQGGDRQAGLLFQLVEGLNVGAGLERSVKISEGSLLSNRFLLGLSKRTIGPGADKQILDICTRLRMPRDLLDAFGVGLADANYVHFGFERGERASLYKVYLEFWRKIEESLRNRPENLGPFLLHLGFKWDTTEAARRATTRYTWHPWLAVEDILARASGLLDPGLHRRTLEILSGILRLASGRIPHQDILYLEVTEEGNPRRSFDINMYRANLRLAELYPLLLQIGGRYSIPFQELQAFYEPIKHKTFGHISGGIDREGKDFLTVYYGVEGTHGSRVPSGFSVDGFTLAAPPPQMRSLTGKSAPPGVETTDETAARLYRSVQSLNVQVGFERSFKFLEGALLGDRFLMGLKRSALGPGSHAMLLDVCRQIEMPSSLLETFRAQLPEATIVLFGFEKNKKSRLCKAYLEFGDRFRDLAKKGPDDPKPVLIHLGFKWDPADNARSSLTRYTCFPWFAVDDMLRRLREVFYRQTDRNPLPIVEGIVTLAATRVGRTALLYFEATEDNNPRASFDINMYRANLRMEELYPLLLQAAEYYSIPCERLGELYEPVKTQIFGHLTGGGDREGRDFLTVYFGEKGSSR